MARPPFWLLLGRPPPRGALGIYAVEPLVMWRCSGTRDHLAAAFQAQVVARLAMGLASIVPRRVREEELLLLKCSACRIAHTVAALILERLGTARPGRLHAQPSVTSAAALAGAPRVHPQQHAHDAAGSV
jgi:hypothetical protein